jgi:hypothetical protein
MGTFWFIGKMDTCNQLYAQSPMTGLMMLRANFSSEAKHVENPTEAVKELHSKILDSVNVKRSMPPNAWLWSLIDNCRNEDDISFLFDVLQNLRRFVSALFLLPSVSLVLLENSHYRV